jgi:threonine synthase
MWKAFQELLAAGWVQGTLPRMYSVQSSGCAPVVRAFTAGAEACEAWAEPWTVASGLRVPAPLGGRVMLQVLRASGGGAVAVDDTALEREASLATRESGVDFSPEGGAAVAAVAALLANGQLRPDDQILAFNTGAGWLYREPGDLPPV